ncbi:anti-sigma factor antagonist [Picosynechococcus sp. NKBG15041c]|uniref:anti-sigma factor antagonist n=1 Tax=Picosynechococcus sp. NKBG15041c TaxID=1407650 RepID=UPI000406A6E0|nr:anti-sigma factor antagonist [Picosynechococcus sp. NKBG15041c]
MSLEVTLSVNNDVATINLSGQLDASSAELFQEKIKEAAAYDLRELILDLKNLDYMASAGLRVLIFSKQQMGSAVTIYLTNTQEMVKETIKKTGFHHSVVLEE